MKNQIYIIVGTSRNPGNTWTVARELEQVENVQLIDLQDLNISYFDYEHVNSEDDFIPLMRTVLTDAKAIVFLTPIYWYTMSAIMKTFLDRFSDLLKIEKDLGRKLRGLSMGVLSCSESDDAPEHFDSPFHLSAKYLGMKYKGHNHIVSIAGVLHENAKERAAKLMNNLDS